MEALLHCLFQAVIQGPRLLPFCGLSIFNVRLLGLPGYSSLFQLAKNGKVHGESGMQDFYGPNLEAVNTIFMLIHKSKLRCMATTNYKGERETHSSGATVLFVSFYADAILFWSQWLYGVFWYFLKKMPVPFCYFFSHFLGIIFCIKFKSILFNSKIKMKEP